MGIDFGKMLSGAAKGVSEFINKAGSDITKAVDQNGDGKLDLADLQKVSERIQASQAAARRKADLERLKPLFPEDFGKAEFAMPKLIRVAEIDKPHAESEVCKGSVGFRTVEDDMTVITIFRSHIGSFGLSFLPELDNGVYYVDPCDKDLYVSLEGYFPYMKQQRVAELQHIAQSLGAKHFRVAYREKNKSVLSESFHTADGIRAAAAKAAAKVSRAIVNSSASAINIEAEMSFPGHPPIEPELRYLKNEVTINTLIRMRMDPLSPLQHHHFTIEMSNSSGIRIKEAAKIDAVIKIMKINSDTSIEKEAQNEAQHVLEYDIDF